MQPQEQSFTAADAPVPEGTTVVERGVSAQEFGPKLNRTAGDVIKFLLQHGEMLTVTMGLSDEHMELYALELGADLLLVDPGQQQEIELQAMFDDSDDDDEELLTARPPSSTASVRPTSSTARPAASPSTSAPIRSRRTARS